MLNEMTSQFAEPFFVPVARLPETFQELSRIHNEISTVFHFGGTAFGR
jgi:hypothetical protein